MNPKRPKITPSQLNLFTEPVTDIYRALEDEVFQMIAKRLKTSADISKDNVFEWQVDKLNQLRMVNNETIKALSEATGMAEKEIESIIEDAMYASVRSVDNEVEQVYEKAKKDNVDLMVLGFVALTLMEDEFKPLNISDSYKNKTNNHKRMLFRDFNALINETLITTNYGQGTVARMYRSIINETVSKVLAGDITVNKAVAETVIKWSEKGLSSGFVDKGGNTWSLQRYADASVRTTVNNIYNDLTTDRMQEYGTDLVLVSSLPDPREACSRIQGNVASLSNPSSNPKYPSIYDFGFGEAWGLRGVNCRHRFFAWFEGISENNQPQYSESEMEHNRELRQKQRYYERQMRDAKRRLKLAEIVGDKDVIEHEKKLLRNRRARMRRFINESGRTREYARERVIV